MAVDLNTSAERTPAEAEPAAHTPAITRVLRDDRWPDWLATAKPKTLSSRRTSLIYDPPDGLIPPQTPEGQKRAAARRAIAGFDSYETRPAQERCIVWTHEGPPMMPPPYNDILQILQMPGYVIMYRELATAPRIIPMDGRSHPPSQVRNWVGHSVGRWEGDTLVVDTTNFNDKAAVQGGGPDLHVIERFTRISADAISYRVLSGEVDRTVKRELDQLLMFSKFRPQLSFRRPTSGGHVVWRFSQISVRG